MNIYEQISSNKRKTVVIMALFVLMVSFVGYVFGEFYSGFGYGMPMMAFAFLFSGASAFTSYYFSDKIVLSIAGAKKVGREDIPGVYGILENLCIGSGIKDIPDLYIIDDSAPNAFATGRDPKHSVIAVTSGLITKLKKREIEGVLAHELSHIKSYDIRLMTIVVVLVGTLAVLANIMIRGNFRGKKNTGFLMIIGIILTLISPLIARLIKLAISRSREYLADASAALLTRDPEGLAMALEKISADTEALEVANEATAHMYISNPLKKGKNAGWFANLFNTHPPVEERVKRLRSM